MRIIIDSLQRAIVRLQHKDKENAKPKPSSNGGLFLFYSFMTRVAQQINNNNNNCPKPAGWLLHCITVARI
jgi:hypothetical protein